MAPNPAPLHTPSGEGRVLQIRSFGIIYKVPGTGADDGASVIEHTLAPGSLAAPLHRHRHEDEISYVLEGEITVQQGEAITVAGVGSYLAKPRGIFTFWNSGTTTARLMEIIAPGGFERYFEELAALIPTDGPPEMEAVLDLADRYGLEFDMDSLPHLMEVHGVRLV